MNRQENIDLLLKKVTIVCLFLLLFAFKPTNFSGGYSFSKIGAVEQILIVNELPILNKPIFSRSFNNTFEQHYKVNNAAILVDSVIVSTLYDTLITFKFNNSDKENYKIINSNNKVCQLLKECKELFIVIKPQIINLDSFHIRTSLNNEEISLIS